MNAPLSLAVLLAAAPCDHEAVIRAEARVARAPALLTLAVMDVESRCRPGAVSSAGALGLMQVLPRWTRTNLAAKCGADLRDPRTSACYGARILRYEHARLGSWPAALAAYSGQTPGYGAAVRAAMRARLQPTAPADDRAEVARGAFGDGAQAGALAAAALVLALAAAYAWRRTSYPCRAVVPGAALRCGARAVPGSPYCPVHQGEPT